MNLSTLSLVCLHFLLGSVSPEEHADRERRDLSMLRMGKRSALELPPLVPPNYEVGDEYEERGILVPESIPRQIWIPRVGKDMDEEGPRDMYERAPPFPRVGKLFAEYLQEIRRDLGQDEVSELLMKYGDRLGRRRRAAQDEQGHNDDNKLQVASDELQAKSQQKRSLLDGEEGIEERAMPFPRIGLQERSIPYPRLGLQERAIPYPRLGLQERAMPFPRLGLVERAFPRIGLQERSASDAQDEEEKRGMSMLRMGKRGMKMLRMGKRPVNMLRMGRSQETLNEVAPDQQQDKRAMSMLRMGKRPMSMLRMGRSDPALSEEDKRAIGMLRMGRSMSMLRMGRSQDAPSLSADSGEDKRSMSMLRMGRAQDTLDGSDALKRSMSMLRMGKRPVSMLRMGKRDAESAADDSQQADSQS